MKIISKIFNAIGFTSIILLSVSNYAQTSEKQMVVSDLPPVIMTKGVNIHFISPEPIQFVDLSTNNLFGDLPTENIARIKIYDNDSVKTINKSYYDGETIGVITITGQSFMAQYKAIYSHSENRNIQSNIQIQPEEMQPLEFPKMAFSSYELYQFSKKIILKDDKNPLRKTDDFKVEIQLNNVYVMNDYIFLDITFKNNSNLGYDIDGLNFTVEDKKIYKATNNQSIDLEPVFQLYPQKEFRKTFRNIYVFKKFTFPNSKVLKIRLIEEQLSGRTIEMDVKYSDILNADTF